jgi:hypothetical protein
MRIKTGFCRAKKKNSVPILLKPILTVTVMKTAMSILVEPIRSMSMTIPTWAAGTSLAAIRILCRQAMR